MQANRSSNTKPELAVRRLIHAAGLRYRVAIRPVQSVRRKADIVFTKRKIAVFIDGCFWHGCPEHGTRTFGHNVKYWNGKIARNRDRDLETNELLRQAGWQVLRYWEHQAPAEVALDIAREVTRAGATT